MYVLWAGLKTTLEDVSFLCYNNKILKPHPFADPSLVATPSAMHLSTNRGPKPLLKHKLIIIPIYFFNLT